jgi:ligand-binding SRPBCC domain-containing protein
MTDIVSYALPFDPLSRPISKILVGRKVREIFNYREKVLKKYFNK